MDVTIKNHRGDWYVCNRGGSYLSDKGKEATFYGDPAYGKGCRTVAAAKRLAKKYNLNVVTVES